jgi:hypothetical protein
MTVSDADAEWFRQRNELDFEFMARVRQKLNLPQRVAKTANGAGQGAIVEAVTAPSAAPVAND